MVASKGRSTIGIRILDESKQSSKKELDFKGHGNANRRTASFVPMDKLNREAIGRGSLPPKSLMTNPLTKCMHQTDQESDKGRVKNGRKVLADIGNLNNRRSQHCTNQLVNKSKIICSKEKVEGAKKAPLDRSKIARDHGRLSLAKSIIVANLSSTKVVRGKSKSFAQISEKSNFPTRRRTVSATYISKENHFEAPFIGYNVNKIQTGKVPQTRFIVGNPRTTKKAATTKKPVVGTSKVQIAVVTRQKSNAKKIEPTENLSDSLKDIVNQASIPGRKDGRRKSYTLSLFLSGCDASKKNNPAANIDDSTNPLEVVDYVDDIYQYYWTMELQRPFLANFMEIQSEITPKMRSILVNWLIEVHHKYNLMEESLFLMVELLDRILSIVNIKKNELQLFGLTTLFLASKYEDYWHPKVNELISLAVNQYTKDEMLELEILILKKMKFRLSVPTPYLFMLRFLKAARSDKKLEDLAFYLIELCLVENESLKYKPSLLCASAIFVARSNLRLNPPWTGLLVKHAHYDEPQLRVCADMILRFQKEASCKPTNYTYQKYLKPDRNCVAAMKPISKLPC